MKPAITTETWVLVLDGAKALVFRNEGFDDSPVLQLVEERAYDPKFNRDMVSDKPGRYQDGPQASRSSVQETDHHELAEAGFVKEVAEWLETAARGGKYDRLAVFADPRSLGRLRADLGNLARERLVGERDKDLTKSPLPDIEKAFAALVADAG